MTTEQIIQLATEELRREAGYHYDEAAIKAAASEGLVDGDRLSCGGNVRCTIIDANAVFTDCEKETGRLPVANLPANMADRLQVIKARQAGRVGTVTGTVRY